MKKGYDNICPVDHCTGCMACTNVCAHSAIIIDEDSLGFKYPKIDTDICIKCGLCRAVCPEINPRSYVRSLKCYAAASNDESQRISCASGGIATELSKYVIKTGGIAVGCTGEDIKNVHHIIIDRISETELLKGSKYVQSNISSDLYKRIRKELLTGRTVLFIGTGCQVAGIQNFFKKTYPNLITVDLVCHGISSQKLLNNDLAFYKDIDLHSIKFREKILYKKKKSTEISVGVKYGLSFIKKAHIEGKEKKKFINYYNDPYLGAFFDNISLRESCYSCRYAQPGRQSDITICDFWGLGKDSPLSNLPSPSAVLINTEKGDRLFENIIPFLKIETRDVKEAIQGNGRLNHPSPHNPHRTQFVTIYEKKGLRKAYFQTSYNRLRLNVIKKSLLNRRSLSTRLLIKLYQLLRPHK